MNGKTAIKYGGISGLLIVSTWFILHALGSDDGEFFGGELPGYVVMLLALTAVFMGVKSRRDQNEKSSFTFKEGFLSGLGIVLVASVIYVIGWFIYMPNFAPDFVDKYEATQIELIENSAVTEDEKHAEIEEIKSSIENYKKPHIMVSMTFLEIFPVGLLVSIITALILRRKN